MTGLFSRGWTRLAVPMFHHGSGQPVGVTPLPLRTSVGRKAPFIRSHLGQRWTAHRWSRVPCPYPLHEVFLYKACVASSRSKMLPRPQPVTRMHADRALPQEPWCMFRLGRKGAHQHVNTAVELRQRKGVSAVTTLAPRLGRARYQATGILNGVKRLRHQGRQRQAPLSPVRKTMKNDRGVFPPWTQ